MQNNEQIFKELIDEALSIGIHLTILTEVGATIDRVSKQYRTTTKYGWVTREGKVWSWARACWHTDVNATITAVKKMLKQTKR